MADSCQLQLLKHVSLYMPFAWTRVQSNGQTWLVLCDPVAAKGVWHAVPACCVVCVMFWALQAELTCCQA